jgi:hypothetical protein
MKRTRKERNEQKIARAFRTYNLANKSDTQREKDYNLGLKVENGTISNVHDLIRAVSIIDELISLDRITKEEANEIKMNLAQKMSGYKIVPK